MADGPESTYERRKGPSAACTTETEVLSAGMASTAIWMADTTVLLEFTMT